MMKGFFKHIKPEFFVILLLGIILATAYKFGWMQRWENIISDYIVTSTTNPKKANKAIILANTTDRCLKEGELYYNIGHPWPRATFDKLYRYLKLSGAELSVVDSIYTERSVYSYSWDKNKDFTNTLSEFQKDVEKNIPAAAVTDIKKKFNNISKHFTKKVLGEDDDLSFAQSMKETDFVVLGTVFSLNDEAFDKMVKDKMIDLYDSKKIKEQNNLISKYLKEEIKKYQNNKQLYKWLEKDFSGKPELKIIKALNSMDKNFSKHLLKEVSKPVQNIVKDPRILELFTFSKDETRNQHIDLLVKTLNNNSEKILATEFTKYFSNHLHKQILNDTILPKIKDQLKEMSIWNKITRSLGMDKKVYFEDQYLTYLKKIIKNHIPKLKLNEIKAFLYKKLKDEMKIPPQNVDDIYEFFKKRIKPRLDDTIHKSDFNFDKADLTTIKKIIEAYLYIDRMKRFIKINNPLLQKSHLKVNVLEQNNVIQYYFGTHPPIPLFIKTAKQLGSVEGPLDKDGKSRHIPLLINFWGLYHPTLSFAAVYQHLKPKKIEIGKDYIKLIDPIDKKDRGDRYIPLTEDGHLRLKYYGRRTVYENYDHIDMMRLYDHIHNLYLAYSENYKDKKPPIAESKLFQSINYVIQVQNEIKSTHPHLIIPPKIDAKSFEHLILKPLGNDDKKLVSKYYIKNKKNIYTLIKSPINDQDIDKLWNIIKKSKYRNTPDNQLNALLIALPYGTFKGKIVLFGAIAAALLDLRPTPFNSKEAGVHVHATALDNIISNDILYEFRENYYLSLIILLLAVITYFAIHRVSIIWGFILTFLFMVLVFGTAILLYVYYNVITDSVTPAAAIFLTFPIVTGINYFRESKQKKYIQSAFGQYLSPKVIEIIINDPGKLNLGGVRRDITAFFSDVAGFSTISEKLSPEDLVQLLNEYLTGMCDIIGKYDGVVDKFEGDAIIAFWGAPLEQDNHAILGCYTSIEMQEKLIELRKEWERQGKHQLYVRIGMNSGPAVVGNLGSQQRMDYTMMGDTVNLASRLEGANKYYKTYTMISDATYSKAKDHIDVRELDKIRVVGKAEPVTVYELLARKGMTSGTLATIIDQYNKAINLYKQQDFTTAIKQFDDILKIFPDDGPSKTYIERCKIFQIKPPGDNWDGVFTLTSK